MLSIKEVQYYAIRRDDLINLVPQGDHKILEIGCGVGNTGLALKNLGKAKEVVGVELFSKAAEEAKSKIDEVITGDIEKLDLPYKEYFDYIICGDVLEHLLDPWSALKKLKKYLTPKGYLIASIPNIQYWRVIRDLLLLGKWEYKNAGILDSTHLRFFTHREIIKLFQSADFQITKISSKIAGKSKIFNRLTFKIFNDFLAFQFLIVAKGENA